MSIVAYNALKKGLCVGVRIGGVHNPSIKLLSKK